MHITEIPDINKLIKIDLDKNLIVHVKQYLSAEDKSKIISALVSESLNTILIDQIKLDALFNAFIILNYTDITIGNNLRSIENLMKIYDYFEATGYMSKIINTIPKAEYDSLLNYLKDTVEDYNKIKVSTVGLMEGLVSYIPTLMENIKESFKDFNTESLKN
jgi:hypothetical protein